MTATPQIRGIGQLASVATGALPPHFRGAMWVCGAGTAAVGAVTLAGYAIGLPVLEILRADFIPMVLGPAILFLLLGTFLVFHCCRAASVWGRVVGVGLAFLTAGFGAWEFSEYLVGAGHSPEAPLASWLAPDSSGPPSYASPLAGIVLFATGLAVLLLVLRTAGAGRSRLWGHTAGALGTVVSVTGATVIMGYLHGTPLLYGTTAVPMAVTTGVAFVLLGAGVALAAGPQCIPGVWLAGPSTRARLLRAFLPITVLAVPAFGLVRHWFPAMRGVNDALVSVATILFFVAVMVAIVFRVSRILGGAIDRAEAERGGAEADLRESEARYRRIVETAAEGVGVIDAEAKVTYVNRRMAEMLGYVPEEMVGRSFLSLLLQEDHADARANLESMRQGRSGHSESRLLRKDGSILWVGFSAAPIPDSEGAYCGVLVMATDITERRRSHERLLEYQQRLRSLASRLVLTEQQERRHIAMYLHDQIGQALAVARIQVAALRRPDAPPDPGRALQGIEDLLGQLINDTRSLTFDLSPPILYELGFEAAVEWLAEKVQQDHGIRVRVENDGQPKPLADDLRVVLFLGLREAVTNVIKHAGARSITVSVGLQEGAVQAVVADDGRGFDVGSLYSAGAAGSRGFGLFSTRERLEHFGGRLQIESAPGRGTRVVLVGPAAPPPPLDTGDGL